MDASKVKKEASEAKIKITNRVFHQVPLRFPEE
jgi:hypothetical protein